MNVEKDLGANLQIRIDQTVERMSDHAFGGVLDGHHAELGAVLGHLLKHFRNAHRRTEIRRRAELFFGGEMAVGRLGAKEHDLERRFERTAAGDYFAIDGADRARCEWTAIEPGESLQNLLLALGNVNLLVT